MANNYPNICFNIRCGRCKNNELCICLTCIHHSTRNWCTCNLEPYYHGVICKHHEKDWVKDIKWKEHVNG